MSDLAPCPFCGTAMLRHDHCFSHPKPAEGDCILRHYSFDKQKAGDWNRRFFAGDEAERARIVEWLRDRQAEWWMQKQGYRASGHDGPYLGAPSYGWAALLIEGGDHLK